MTPPDHQFADYIAARRKERGLSMAQVAKEAGVSKSNVHYWEAGHVLPKASAFEPLARALGVSYEDLLAVAGHGRPEELPAFTPYLRAKYGALPDEAVAEAEEFFAGLTRRYGSEKGEEGGDAEPDR